MDFLSLIPSPDTIPAPAWLLLVLDLLTFTLHILVINVLLGCSLISLFAGIRRGEDDPWKRLQAPAATKIPTLFAIGINLGVAPLLFLQVIYGHLFYTSSVLMAVYWILIIPFLLLAYYGAYIYSRKYGVSEVLSKTALWAVVLLILYIGWMLVNNNTLMLRPEKWAAYFDHRGGTILNLDDPTLLPRYLHFVAASVAVGALFLAVIWSRRKKNSVEGAGERVTSSLKIFAWATVVQMLIGIWFILALPKAFRMNFMGGHVVATVLLAIGLVGALGAVVGAFRGNLRGSISMILITLLTMILNRQNLRVMYLEDVFHLDSLKMAPQYGVLALFLFILLIGLVAVGYMLKISMKKTEGGAV